MMKIVKSMAIIVAAVSVIGAGTYAAFSNTATMTGVTFSTGTVDIQVDKNPLSGTADWSDGFVVDPSLFIKNLYPGYPVTPEEVNASQQIVDLRNVGSLEGKVNVTLDTTTPNSDLAKNLTFKIYNKNTPEIFYIGTLQDLDGKAYDLGALIPATNLTTTPQNEITSVVFEWSVSGAAGNEIQGKTVAFNVLFDLVK